MATGKTLIGFEAAGLDRFVKNDFTTSTITVASSFTITEGNYATKTATATKSGYSPLYVCGYRVDEEPTGSGQFVDNTHMCNVVQCYLSSDTITVTLRAVTPHGVSGGNHKAIVTIKVVILWVKN